MTINNGIVRRHYRYTVPHSVDIRSFFQPTRMQHGIQVSARQVLTVLITRNTTGLVLIGFHCDAQRRQVLNFAFHFIFNGTHRVRTS